MMRAGWLIVAAMLAAGTAAAQRPPDPIQWRFEVEPEQAAPGGRAVGRLTAQIEPGWHLYSTTTPQGRPIALTLALTDSPAVASWKAWQSPPERQFDPILDSDSEWYKDEATFLVEIETAAAAAPGDYPLELQARWALCDDRQCLPPRRDTIEATLTLATNAAAAAPAIPDDYQPAAPAEATATSPSPVPTAAGPPAAAEVDRGFFQFAAVAFGFGLLAIFTPCVFPMIPITMSYFVSTQSGSPRASLMQATTFCLGVITLFTGLGALVAAVLGPFGMTQLGSNVWVNLFIALIFFVFGASLLGVFEITAPSGMMTALNKTTYGGGIFATLMMGLVFALASFACTGPFVGALLAGSVQGGLAWPIFGMLMFSTGLALPFFFLALFPSYLARMPKAGGWLARTKITMSFVLFAAGFKYLSNVDQMYQWHVLTRERFLAIWIVLFVLAGLYLLGLLRLEQDPEERVGAGRLTAGAVFLFFAVSLVPGMFGARLGEIDAFVPSPEYSGLAGFGGGGGSAGPTWIKDDYEGALAQAKQEDKRLLVSFTGYSCTNCKWMKANMFPRPEVAEALNDLVLVELYTDGLDEHSEANQQLQLERFGTAAIPYYALLSPSGETVAEFPGRTRDVDAFRRFLESGSSSARAGMDVSSLKPPRGRGQNRSDLANTGNSRLPQIVR